MFGETPSLLLMLILAGGADQPLADRSRFNERYQAIALQNPLSQIITESELRHTNLIKKGVLNGDLTGFEAKTLRHHGGSILGLKEKFITDGKLSNREIKILQRKLDRVTQDISRLTRNEKRAYDRHYADGSAIQNQRMNVRASLRY